MNRIVNYIKNPKVFAEVVLHRCGFIPDELYVRLQFRLLAKTCHSQYAK